MKITVGKIAVLAAVVYLAGLLALFPASIAARWFMPQVPGLALGALDGSAWRGRAASIEYRGLNLGELEWQVHPLALLGLSLHADIRLQRENGAPISTSLRTGTGGRIELAPLRGTLTLADLAQARLMPANVASGDVLVDLSRLVIENQRPVAAEGRLGLANLQSTLLPGVALGSYEARVVTENDVISATFGEVEAPIDVEGEARVQADGSYRASGTLAPTTQTPENLRRGLALLGSPDNAGRYRFSFEGRL